MHLEVLDSSCLCSFYLPQLCRSTLWFLLCFHIISLSLNNISNIKHTKSKWKTGCLIFPPCGIGPLLSWSLFLIFLFAKVTLILDLFHFLFYFFDSFIDFFIVSSGVVVTYLIFLVEIYNSYKIKWISNIFNDSVKVALCQMRWQAGSSLFVTCWVRFEEKK